MKKGIVQIITLVIGALLLSFAVALTINVSENRLAEQQLGATVLFPYQGGTGQDTSSWTGVVRVDGGTWSTTTAAGSPFTDEGTVIRTTDGESVKASFFTATSTSNPSTFAGGVISSASSTFTDEVHLNGNVALDDDKFLYLDTANSEALFYNSNSGQITIGDNTQEFNYLGTSRALVLSANAGALGAGTYEPSIYMNEGGDLSTKNTTQGTVGNRYFSMHFTDGLRLRTDTNSFYANFLADNLTANREIQVPDSAGTIALTTDMISHEYGGLETDVSAYTGLLAISGGATSEVDSKSELEAQIADVANFAEADGDTYSGTHNFSSATVNLPADGITHADIADADQAFTSCIYLEDPTADDDLQSIFANKTANDILLTEIWGESDQTVNFDFQIDDGTPADVNGTDISPAAGEAEDTSLSGDTTIAAGEEVDLAITSVSGTPTWLSACITGNWVD